MQRPARYHGLVVMDSPGREPEILTDLAAAAKLTKAEISGYTKAMDIYTVGPVI